MCLCPPCCLSCQSNTHNSRPLRGPEAFLLLSNNNTRTYIYINLIFTSLFLKLDFNRRLGMKSPCSAEQGSGCVMHEAVWLSKLCFHPMRAVSLPLLLARLCTGQLIRNISGKILEMSVCKEKRG